MYRIIYLSSAVTKLSDEEISSLLIQSRKHNTEYNITGVLVYIEGDFIQVLEGKKETILFLFEKIKNDSRHKGIICVFNDSIKERQFKDWSMGFCSLEYQNLRSIVECSSFYRREDLFNNTDKVASIFLDTFTKSHKNKIIYF